KPDGGNLSSRKIVWLEKLKHYLNIGACNFQLKLHLYSGQEGRESLKVSKDLSRHALSILKHGETRQSNLSKAKEDFEDGQYVNAAHKFGEAGIAGFKEGKSRAWTWLRA
ncbi:hypothetical protein, partial [Endozoicomonas sp.]|uniref:hypothetical protein n=1 Tax=Endozoicomonas sp. TaxID=1892382 RepID=UPI00383AD8F5